VKEIAEAHGGTISVASQIHKGSIFTLRLPVSTHQPVSA
jgi:signal transduction histidine kinase